MSGWSRQVACFTVLLAGTVVATVQATQDAVQAAVRAHARALEESSAGSIEALIARFEAERFSSDYLKRTPAAERRLVLEAVRAAASQAGNVLIRSDGETRVLTLQGDRTVEVAFTLQPRPPYRIDSLEVRDAKGSAPASLRLTRENLPDTLARYEGDGLAGAISVTDGSGATAFERFFGLANPELGAPMHHDTVFAIGSFPIEFTLTSILLLEERGMLGLDDTVDKFLPDVPSDKKTMTLRHLANGQSGLPDFFHLPTDWNADLAWVDRVAAERRILGQRLLFVPGTDQRHSHAAFGLLAAIVERVSGEAYPTFVRRHILAPAGMTRTGFNGESLGLKVGEFAVGRGVESAGVPNIPPNWGPTSWLVMGSGGMFSTLSDLQRFYAAMRSNKILAAPRSDRFRRETVSQDGSDRGFELFHAYNPKGGEVFLLVNVTGPGGNRRQLFDGLAQLVGLGGR